MPSTLSIRWSLIDTCLNLTDEMFQGRYNGRQYHKSDIKVVLKRAQEVGVHGLLLAGTSAKDSTKAIQLCEEYSTDTLKCLSTVGCHPTHTCEFEADPEAYFDTLDKPIAEHSIVCGGCVAGIGEIGLDYDRTFFAGKETQLKYFAKQLVLAERHQLPLLLHERNTGGDFHKVLSKHQTSRLRGVVHSFTGTQEDMTRHLESGFYIGINGCSLKAQSNLNVVKRIPVERLLIETDAPWCGLTSTHASYATLRESAQCKEGGLCESEKVLSEFPVCRKDKYTKGAIVKGRCEPCHLVRVLDVLYQLHRDDIASIEELAKTITENTKKLFAFSTPYPNRRSFFFGN